MSRSLSDNLFNKLVSSSFAFLDVKLIVRFLTVLEEKSFKSIKTFIASKSFTPLKLSRLNNKRSAAELKKA